MIFDPPTFFQVGIKSDGFTSNISYTCIWVSLSIRGVKKLKPGAGKMAQWAKKLATKA